MTEAYLLGDGLQLATRGIVEPDDKVIEDGSAVAPRLDMLKFARYAGKPIAFRERMHRDDIVGRIEELYLATAHLAVEVDQDIQQAGGVVAGVEVGDNFDIGDIGLWYGVEQHVAGDAAHTPHVLTLKVAAVAPADNLDGHTVAALMQIARDVPLGRGLRVLAVAHLVAVDVEIHGRLDGTELHYHATSVPMGRHGEVASIDTYGVVVGGSVGRIARELVLHVDIHRHAVALQLDIARHTDGVPMVGLQRGLLRIVKVSELPRAVEAAHPIALGNDAVVRLKLVDAIDLQVVPIGLCLCKTARQQQQGQQYVNSRSHRLGRQENRY